MNHTQNLHLPQWEKTDRLMMDDFNAAFDKIDTALAAANDAAAAAPKVVTGSYTGDGQSVSRSFTLGGRPKVLLLGCDSNNSGTSYYQFVVLADSFAFVGMEGGKSKTDGASSFVSFSANGFALTNNGDNVSHGFNRSGKSYHYLAIL